jgi:hypothetical protein
MEKTGTFDYRIEDGILWLTYVGDVGIPTIAATFERIVADPCFRPGMPTLTDVRRSATFLEVADLQTVREMMAEAHRGATGERRSAVISDDPMADKMVRLGQDVFDQKIGELRVRLRHYPARAMSEALAWIKGGAVKARSR